jgi:hemoglobin-like flavoprotein
VLKKLGYRIILFKRFFIAAPDTFLMFDEFRDLPDWEESRKFKHHCKIVMNIIGSAVNILREPESLDSTLEYLGLKHEGFAITQAHFDLMGVEFLETLKDA